MESEKIYVNSQVFCTEFLSHEIDFDENPFLILAIALEIICNLKKRQKTQL